MKKAMRRPLALLLVVAMLIGLFPAGAIATEPTLPEENGTFTETTAPPPATNGTAAITSMVLKDYDENGDYDLLNGTSPVEWDLFTPYTLEIGVSLPAGAADNQLTLTLPYGMAFDSTEIGEVIGVASSSFERDDKVYTYQPNSGTLTVNFESGASDLTIAVSIRPDVAFFPVEKAEGGFLVENGIKVSLNDGAATFATNVLQKTTETPSNPYIGDVKQSEIPAVAGSAVSVQGYAYHGWIGDASNYHLVKKQVMTLSVPEVLTLSSKNWTLKKGEVDPGRPENVLWTATCEKHYGAMGPEMDFEVAVAQTAEEGDYVIMLTQAEVTTYGQDTSQTTTMLSMPWTIQVKDPEKTYLTMDTPSLTNVYNFTKQGNEEEDFADYQTLLSGVRIVNKGLGAIDEPLIYEATFDTESQFVTAVGIPCGWSATEGNYMPIKVTVKDESGTSHEITDVNTMRAIAFQPYDNHGFVLRAENIEGFDTNKSIQSVTVELPGLPKGYESSGYASFFEGGGLHSPTAGAWGRVQEDVADNTKVKNKYRIDPASERAPKYTTITTTIRDSGKYTGTNGSATIKVDGAVDDIASSGNNINIRYNLSSHPSHRGAHAAEAMLVDPVIYVLEPADLELGEVSFSLNSGSKLSYEEKEPQTLADGSILHVYEPQQKVVIGYWNSDWQCNMLQVDVNYTVAPTASTKTYDINDLIFFTTMLDEMSFFDSMNAQEDKYGVNDGKNVGGIVADTLTVQQSSSFEVSAAIQIDGEDDWYTYNDSDPKTMAVFTDGATANVKITIVNNSGENAEGVDVYVPVPKKEDKDKLGAAFLGNIGFDMFVGGNADLSKAVGWSVSYGQVEEVSYTTEGAVDDIQLAGGTDWSTSFDDDANMIKLSLPDTMTFATGENVEVILKFKATNDTKKIDERNIFKSWYTYQTTTAAIQDTATDYNFGTLLQNGVVSGVVYEDRNGNSQQDVGEPGISDVDVMIADEAGLVYTTKTDSDGHYEQKSLPGNQVLTVSIDNPGTPNADADNAYRFSDFVTSGNGIVGTDVRANADGSAATATLTSLGDSGTATINAGLTTPVTVQFTVDGDHGSVSPAMLKVFVGDTIETGLGTQSLTVTPADGWEFAGTWKLDGAESAVTQETLLAQTVTGDEIYVAQMQEKAPEIYTITVDETKHGSVTTNPEGSAEEGVEVKITVTPDKGYQLKEDSLVVKGEDDAPITVNAEKNTFTMPAEDVTVSAEFEAVEYDITYVLDDGTNDAANPDTYTVESETFTLKPPTREGYIFTGWTWEGQDDPKTEVTIAKGSTGDLTFTAHWEIDTPVPAGTIKVTPANIIIYMGGKSYEGVVNEEGTLVSDQSVGLPEPGFTFELPEKLATDLQESGEDITAVEFMNGNGTKTWKVQLYAGLSANAERKLYSIVPTYGTNEKPADPVRVQFRDGEKVIVSDKFTVGQEINKTFAMSLYTGDNATIKAEYNNKVYTITLGEGALQVLGTTDEVSITPVVESAPENGKAGAVADAGTTYTINDSEVAVTDGDVSLLFDDIINSDGNDRTTKLQERADEFLQSESSIPAEGKEFAYEFKYLDLVDANNGNAWVTASDDLTIYWPLPKGADANSVKVLHFKDLHRDMATGEIEDKIEDSTVETIEAKVEGNHVTFNVGRGGFSPFALVWETAVEQPSVEKHTITASAGHGGKISPDGTVTVDEGENQTFTITANSGFSIADVVVDGKSVGAVESYTFDNVTEDHTINVTFERDYTPPPYDPGDPDPEPEPDDPEPDEPDTPDDLNTVDHFSYVVGYEDGTVMPQKQITRAEVATIFYRLLKADVRDENTTDVSDFSDVKSSDWYGTTVATLADMGIVKGYEDGTFRPNAPITRAEFAAIATRFFDETGATYEPGTFTDVTGSEWFAGAIMDAVNLGLIGGYEDGTVRPNNNITRAEACAIVNRTLGRVPDADHLLPEDEMKTWPDNPESAWFYADMQEATNGHEYEWITEDGNKIENWTDLLDKDWNDR